MWLTDTLLPRNKFFSEVRFEIHLIDKFNTLQYTYSYDSESLCIAWPHIYEVPLHVFRIAWGLLVKSTWTRSFKIFCSHSWNTMMKGVHIIGPPSHWSPISLVPHLIGPPSHWSPISLVPFSLVPQFISPPLHYLNSLVPLLIGPPFH